MMKLSWDRREVELETGVRQRTHYLTSYKGNKQYRIFGIISVTDDPAQALLQYDADLFLPPNREETKHFVLDGLTGNRDMEEFEVGYVKAALEYGLIKEYKERLPEYIGEYLKELETLERFYKNGDK